MYGGLGLSDLFGLTPRQFHTLVLEAHALQAGDDVVAYGGRRDEFLQQMDDKMAMEYEPTTKDEMALIRQRSARVVH